MYCKNPLKRITHDFINPNQGVTNMYCKTPVTKDHTMYYKKSNNTGVVHYVL